MKNCLLVLSIFLAACSGPKSKYPVVKIDTDYGNIEAEIYDDKAPKTAGAFLKNVDAGVYNKTSFYRVVQDDQSSYPKGVIQGGVHATAPAKAEALPYIEHESPSVTGIHHTDGTLSMARTAAGTARSEFFICIGDQSPYDGDKLLQPDGLGYAAFGRVISGMDVVRKIQSKGRSDEKFSVPITINNISRE